MGQMQSSPNKQKFTQFLKAQDEQTLHDQLTQILLINITQEEYLKSLYPSDIRDLIQSNQATIVLTLQFLHKFLTKNELAPNSQFIQVKNALRILTTIIPIMYEKANRQFMLECFYYQKTTQELEEESDRDPPFILGLLKCLVELCFKIGFTISVQQETQQEGLLQSFKLYFKQEWSNLELKEDMLWKGFDPICSYNHDNNCYYENRYLVLSAIQAIISQSLYEPEFYRTVDQRIEQQPNANLLALQKLRFFPELFVSMVAFGAFPSEKVTTSISKLLPKSEDQNYIKLSKICLQIVKQILGGQDLLYNKPDTYCTENYPEMSIMIKHFKYFNCPFPQIIRLPFPVKERIMIQCARKLFTYFKTQNQIIRGCLEQQLIFDDAFLFLSYLCLSTKMNIPDIMKLYLLSSFHAPQYIKKISRCILLLLSQSGILSKQFSQEIQFILTMSSFPIIQGNWIDLYVVTMVKEIFQSDRSEKSNKQVLQLTQIFVNLSSDCGPLNKQSSLSICQLLQCISLYDYFLRSPILFEAILNIINGIYQIILNNPDQSIQLVYQLRQIKPSIQFISKCQINGDKIHHWWIKHQDTLDKSFMQEKKGSDIENRRESSLRSATQQMQSNQNKQGKSISFQQQDITSPRLLTVSNLSEQWQQWQSKDHYNYSKNLDDFLNQVQQLAPQFDNINQLSKFYSQHNIVNLIQQNEVPKITIPIFNIYKLVSKQIWCSCLRTNDKFPYFEKVECVYFLKGLKQKD